MLFIRREKPGAFGTSKYQRIKYGTKKRPPKKGAYAKGLPLVTVVPEILQQERNRRRRIRRIVINAPRVKQGREQRTGVYG